jgi:hypothetical protein
VEYERLTREQRYGGATLHVSLKAPRFNPPAVSQVAADRLKKAMNNSPPLGLGQSGEAVTALQKALLDLHQPSIKIPDGATGYFGNQTQEALITFQKLFKLVKRDGLAGNETLGRLDELYRGGNPQPPPPDYDDDVVLYCPNHMMIPRLKQPLNSVCWATSAAMAYYWKYPAAFASAPRGIHEVIKHVLRRCPLDPQGWLKLYGDNQGLFGLQNKTLYATELGMQNAGASPHEDYGIGFWTGKLVRSPIVLISAQIVPVEALEGHAVVVIGLRRFASDNVPKVYVIDPWDGLDKE